MKGLVTQVYLWGARGGAGCNEKNNKDFLPKDPFLLQMSSTKVRKWQSSWGDFKRCNQFDNSRCSTEILYIRNNISAAVEPMIDWDNEHVSGEGYSIQQLINQNENCNGQKWLQQDFGKIIKMRSSIETVLR